MNTNEITDIIAELDLEFEEQKQGVTDNLIWQTIKKYEHLLSELSQKELIDLQLSYAFKRLSTISKATPDGGVPFGMRKENIKNVINYIKRLSQINYPDMTSQIDFSSIISQIDELEEDLKKAYSLKEKSQEEFLEAVSQIEYPGKNELAPIFNSCEKGSSRGREMLNSFKKEMIQVQSENSGYVYTALGSNKSGLKELTSSKHRENQYYNDVSDGVFAISNVEGLEGYIGRANVGGMNWDRDEITYPSNPFSEVNEEGAKLINPVSVYLSNSNEFEPQFDFQLDQNGKPHIIFGGEWVAKKEKVSCKETKVSSLPLSFVEEHNVYYRENGEVVKIQAKQNKTLTLNNQNATASSSPNSSNGFGYTVLLVAIVSFAIGVISTITYLVVSSIFK